MPATSATVMPFHSAVASTSMRLPAPVPPSIYAPSRRPEPRSTTILIFIGSAPG